MTAQVGTCRHSSRDPLDGNHGTVTRHERDIAVVTVVADTRHEVRPDADCFEEFEQRAIGHRAESRLADHLVRLDAIASRDAIFAQNVDEVLTGIVVELEDALRLALDNEVADL